CATWDSSLSTLF
nr:immunoglobulin light chain junction region [Macaca mulatta]